MVIRAALQLVVVTALYRPGKPPCALEASPRGWFRMHSSAPLCSPVLSLLKETQPSPSGATAAPVLNHGERIRW